MTFQRKRQACSQEQNGIMQKMSVVRQEIREQQGL